MASPKSVRRQNDKHGYLTGILVFAAAIVFGLFVLPRFGGGPKSALIGKQAPDFILPVIYGQGRGDKVRLSDHQGRVVVLDFWASWCGPCRRQTPIVDRVAKTFENQPVTVLGIASSDREEAAQGFLEKQGVSYRSLYDEDNVASAAFGVSVLPTLVVIDKSGSVTWLASRLVSQGELEELVRKALEP